jgi:hypothetical protein
MLIIKVGIELLDHLSDTGLHIILTMTGFFMDGLFLPVTFFVDLVSQLRDQTIGFIAFDIV